MKVAIKRKEKILKLKFKKLSNRWFIDIPYDGDIGDLEMVLGADLLLGSVKSMLTDSVTLDIVPYKTCNELRKIEEDRFGCTYYADTANFKGEIWLCNITKILFGRFPNVINFQI